MLAVPSVPVTHQGRIKPTLRKFYHYPPSYHVALPAPVCVRAICKTCSSQGHSRMAALLCNRVHGSAGYRGMPLRWPFSQLIMYTFPTALAAHCGTHGESTPIASFFETAFRSDLCTSIIRCCPAVCGVFTVSAVGSYVEDFVVRESRMGCTCHWAL